MDKSQPKRAKSTFGQKSCKISERDFASMRKSILHLISTFLLFVFRQWHMSLGYHHGHQYCSEILSGAGRSRR